MHISLLGAVLIVAVVATWVAVGGYWYRAIRCRRHRDAEWEAIVVHLRDLEADLERVWLSEVDRTWPYRLDAVSRLRGPGLP
jgi:hypothetical protein